MGRESRASSRSSADAVRARLAIHKHQDSYCMITYRCPASHEERVYNNRDGAAPQSIGCWHEGCGRMAVRRDLRCDWYYPPPYRPEPRTRMFATMTHDELARRMQRVVEEQWKDPDSVLRRIFDGDGGQPAAVEMMIKKEMEREKALGWGLPDLVVVLDEKEKRAVEAMEALAADQSADRVDGGSNT